MQPDPAGGGPRATSDASIAAPLRLFHTTVSSTWVDYNAHMSEWCFLFLMGESSDAFFRFVGIDEDYRRAGASLFTVETHIRNLREVHLGDELSLALHVFGVDSKRVHIGHEVVRGDGNLAATGEQMLLHVDTRSGKTSALPEDLRRRIEQVRLAHELLPVPEWVGRAVRVVAPDASAGHNGEEGRGWTSS